MIHAVAPIVLYFYISRFSPVHMGAIPPDAPAPAAAAATAAVSVPRGGRSPARWPVLPAPPTRPPAPHGLPLGCCGPYLHVERINKTVCVRRIGFRGAKGAKRT